MRYCRPMQRPPHPTRIKSTARRLVTAAFDDLAATLVSRWAADATTRARAAERLYHLALDDDHGLLQWHGVQRAAEAVAALLEADSRERWRATFAAQIARRHQGDSVQVPWPDDLVDLSALGD